MVLDYVRLGSSPSTTFTLLGQSLTMDNRLVTLFTILGSLFALKQAYCLLRLLLELTLIPGTNIKTFQGKQHHTGDGKTWAIVTGVTNGIGPEYARQLAAKGYNLVLVSRRQAPMDELASELATKHSAAAKVVLMDFSDPASRSQACAEISAICASHDVGVLINNAGMSHEYPEPFAETDPVVIDSIVQTNVLGTLQLTRAVLPHMLARYQKGKGPKSLILNMGSMDGRIPCPLLAVYSYTKGGLETFTKALAWEVKGKGVVVEVVLPALVISNMSKIRRASLTVPTAKSFVRSVFTSIGLPRGAQGRPYTMTPYWTHALMDYFTGIAGYASEWTGIWVVDVMHKDIRRRALAKKARLAKAQ